MTDHSLKRAYRKLTAQRAGGELPAADDLAVLGLGKSLGGRRDTVLAATAGSARNADLLRALRSLAADADTLAADVAKLRRPQTSPIPRRTSTRRWLALAASLGLAAVIVGALPSEAPSPDAAVQGAPVDALPAADGRIMTASFEADRSAPAPTKIFRGDFDA